MLVGCLLGAVAAAAVTNWGFTLSRRGGSLVSERGLLSRRQVSLELARILDEDGYLADFEALPDGTFRITEHNCAILGVARRWGLACSTEIEFLREALPEARVERVAHMMAGAHVCRYEIKPRRRSGARTRL